MDCRTVVGDVTVVVSMGAGETMRRDDVVVWLVTTGSSAQPLKKSGARRVQPRMTLRMGVFIGWSGLFLFGGGGCGGGAFFDHGSGRSDNLGHNRGVCHKFRDDIAVTHLGVVNARRCVLLDRFLGDHITCGVHEGGRLVVSVFDRCRRSRGAHNDLRGAGFDLLDNAVGCHRARGGNHCVLGVGEGSRDKHCASCGKDGFFDG